MQYEDFVGCCAWMDRYGVEIRTESRVPSRCEGDTKMGRYFYFTIIENDSVKDATST